MVARIFIPIIFAIVLPDFYFYTRYWRHYVHSSWWKRILWWIPGLCMMVYTIALTSIRNFAPDDLTWLNVYLLLVGLWVIPKAIFAFCSFLGWQHCKYHHTHTNWGNYVAIVLCLFQYYIVIYGCTIGWHQLTVKHVDIYAKELPAAFDNYKVVLFSDAHVGTYTGSWRKILARDIDSINAQKGDMICFAGDLQNMQPHEIRPVQGILSRLHAKDGVFSVLGNHDYSMYISKKDPIQRAKNERETVFRELQCGWTLLRNEHRTIYRGKDSIVIAGEENDGRKPFPAKADLKKTLQGVSQNAYVIMLQHDPSAWDRHILPGSHVQLTLCGHTHGGQFSLFGMRLTRLTYQEDDGLYLSGHRQLYVTAGIGGFVPFRFGVSPEIVVLTLHHLK